VRRLTRSLLEFRSFFISAALPWWSFLLFPSLRRVFPLSFSLLCRLTALPFSARYLFDSVLDWVGLGSSRFRSLLIDRFPEPSRFSSSFRFSLPPWLFRDDDDSFDEMSVVDDVVVESIFRRLLSRSLEDFGGCIDVDDFLLPLDVVLSPPPPSLESLLLESPDLLDSLGVFSRLSSDFLFAPADEEEDLVSLLLLRLWLEEDFLSVALDVEVFVEVLPLVADLG